MYIAPSVHYNTSNLSALKLYALYKQLSIKNCTFMLTLYDTDLMNINPFSKSLSVDMQRRVHAEIVRNYWYFAREIVRINVAGGQVGFEFNRGNTALTWLMLNNINTYTEIPRQTTKTGTVAARIAYQWAFGTCNSKVSLLSKDPESVKDNMDTIRSVLKNLPWYIQMLDEKRDASNKESIISSTTRNRIIARNPPGNEQRARNKGRGSTEEVQWIDEVPHIKLIPIVILNSGFSWQKAKEAAKEHNVPYGRIFTSTPGVLDTPEGDFIYYNFLPQCIPFDERLFYDQSSLEALEKLIFMESKNNFVYVRFTYTQLGKDDKYLQEMYRISQNNIETVEREVLLKWARKSNDSPFTKDQLDRIFKHIRDPIGTITIRKTYTLKVFKNLDSKKKYVIGVDCSGMLDNDYASIVVIDPHTFEVIATLKSNARTLMSNTTIFSWAVIDITRSICKEGLVVIEKNNMGIAVVDNIMSFAPDIVPRLYASAFEPSTKADTRESLMSYTMLTNINLEGKTVAFGFDTTVARRNQMFSEVLGIVVTELYDYVNDIDIYTELNNIIKNKKGKLEHRSGKHDDLLFAYLIGLWVLCFSKILQERYEYPLGYIRPMSLLEEDSQTTLSVNGNITNSATIITNLTESALRIYNAHKIFNKQGINPETINVDTRTTRDIKDDIYKRQCMSYAEIAEYIYDDERSIVDVMNDNSVEKENIELENPHVEDIMQNSKEMDDAKKNEYMQKWQRMRDSHISDIKYKTRKKYETAKNVKKRLDLQNSLEKFHNDKSFITTIIDEFISK